MAPMATYKVFLEKLGGTDPSSFIGRVGDLFYDPYTGILRVSDGVTHGGNPIGQGPQSNLNGGTF